MEHDKVLTHCFRVVQRFNLVALVRGNPPLFCKSVDEALRFSNEAIQTNDSLALPRFLVAREFIKSLAAAAVDAETLEARLVDESVDGERERFGNEVLREAMPRDSSLAWLDPSRWNIDSNSEGYEDLHLAMLSLYLEGQEKELCRNGSKWLPIELITAAAEESGEWEEALHADEIAAALDFTEVADLAIQVV